MAANTVEIRITASGAEQPPGAPERRPGWRTDRLHHRPGAKQAEGAINLGASAVPLKLSRVSISRQGSSAPCRHQGEFIAESQARPPRGTQAATFKAFASSVGVAGDALAKASKTYRSDHGRGRIHEGRLRGSRRPSAGSDPAHRCRAPAREISQVDVGRRIRS